jgi:hypothetical protein
MAIAEPSRLLSSLEALSKAERLRPIRRAESKEFDRPTDTFQFHFPD